MVLLILVFVCFENIAHAAKGVNEFLREAAVDLIAQPADQDVDDVGLWVEMEIPNMFQDHRFGQNTTWMAQHVFKQRVFAGLQIEQLVAAADFTLEDVQGQVGITQAGGFNAAAGAAQKGLDTGQEFSEEKGFDQIIIRPFVQRRHPLVGALFGAENQQWRVDPVLPQSAQKADAVELGQHDVDDGGIEGLVEREVEAALPVLGMGDDKAGLPEPLRHEGSDFQIVFDQEKAHGVPCTAH